MPKKPEVVTVNLNDANAFAASTGASEAPVFSVTLPEEIRIASVRVTGVRLELTLEEAEVLRKVRERDRTAAIVHGGLKSLLTLSDDDYSTLMSILNRLG